MKMNAKKTLDYTSKTQIRPRIFYPCDPLFHPQKAVASNFFNVIRILRQGLHTIHMIADKLNQRVINII